MKNTWIKSRKSLAKRLTGGGILSTLSILSLVCVGYSSWVISGNSSGSAEIKVDVAGIEETPTSLFRLDSSKCTNLQYYLSSDQTSGGLVNDGIIGSTGSITFYLTFNMSTFRSKFSWSSINFKFTLGYSSSITTLSLINSSTTATLKSSLTTNNVTPAASDDSSLTWVSADSSTVVYKSVKSVSSSDTYSSINFYITYLFTVNNALAESKALSSLSTSSSVFNIKATATDGSAS